MATKSNELNLTSKQRKLAELLANPDFTGSITELCRECGVARSTYYKWLDKPELQVEKNADKSGKTYKLGGYYYIHAGCDSAD